MNPSAEPAEARPATSGHERGEERAVDERRHAEERCAATRNSVRVDSVPKTTRSTANASRQPITRPRRAPPSQSAKYPMRGFATRRSEAE